MYPLGTWFVSEICVWLPCIKETMMMMMILMMMIITIIIIILVKTTKLTEYEDIHCYSNHLISI